MKGEGKPEPDKNIEIREVPFPEGEEPLAQKQKTLCL